MPIYALKLAQAVRQTGVVYAELKTRSVVSRFHQVDQAISQKLENHSCRSKATECTIWATVACQEQNRKQEERHADWSTLQRCVVIRTCYHDDD